MTARDLRMSGSVETQTGRAHDSADRPTSPPISHTAPGVYRILRVNKCRHERKALPLHSAVELDDAHSAGSVDLSESGAVDAG